MPVQPSGIRPEPFEEGKPPVDEAFLRKQIEQILQPEAEEAKGQMDRLSHEALSVRDDLDALEQSTTNGQAEIDDLFTKKEAEISSFLKTQLPPGKVEPFLTKMREEWHESHNLHKNVMGLIAESEQKAKPSPEEVYRAAAKPKAAPPPAAPPAAPGAAPQAPGFDINDLIKKFLEMLKEGQLVDQLVGAFTKGSSAIPGLEDALNEWKKADSLGTAGLERKEQLYEKIKAMLSGNVPTDEAKKGQPKKTAEEPPAPPKKPSLRAGGGEAAAPVKGVQGPEAGGTPYYMEFMDQMRLNMQNCAPYAVWQDFMSKANAWGQLPLPQQLEAVKSWAKDALTKFKDDFNKRKDIQPNAYEQFEILTFNPTNDPKLSKYADLFNGVFNWGMQGASQLSYVKNIWGSIFQYAWMQYPDMGKIGANLALVPGIKAFMLDPNTYSNYPGITSAQLSSLFGMIPGLPSDIKPPQGGLTVAAPGAPQAAEPVKGVQGAAGPGGMPIVRGSYEFLESIRISMKNCVPDVVYQDFNSHLDAWSKLSLNDQLAAIKVWAADAMTKFKAAFDQQQQWQPKIYEQFQVLTFNPRHSTDPNLVAYEKLFVGVFNWGSVGPNQLKYVQNIWCAIYQFGWMQYPDMGTMEKNVALSVGEFIKDPMTYAKFPGVTYDQIMSLMSLIPGLSTDAPPPKPTDLDQSIIRIYYWMKFDLTPADRALASALSDAAINLRLEGETSLAKLLSWAKGFEKDPIFINASPVAQMNFMVYAGYDIKLKDQWLAVQNWLNRQPPISAADKALVLELQNAIISLTEQGKGFADLTNWAKTMIGKEPYNSCSPDAKIQFLLMTGFDVKLYQQYQAALAWFATTTEGSRARQIAEHLLEAIANLAPNGTFAQLQEQERDYIQKNADSFFGMSGPNQTAFFNITGTQLEGVWYKIKNWGTNDAEFALRDAIIKQIGSLEDAQAGNYMNNLLKFVNDLFSKGVYFSFIVNNVGIGPKSLEGLCKLINPSLAPPPLNDMDKMLLNSLLFMANCDPKDKPIWQQFIDQIKASGHNGKVTDIQAWARNNFFTLENFDKVFMQLSEATRNRLMELTGTQIEPSRIALLKFESTLAPDDPTRKLIEAIYGKYFDVEANFGSLDDLKKILNTTLFKPGIDLYFTYPGMTDQQLSAICNLFGITPPPVTDLDKALFNSYRYASTTDGGFFKQIFAYLRDNAAVCQKWTLKQFQDWATKNFKLNDPWSFWETFGNFSKSDIDAAANIGIIIPVKPVDPFPSILNDITNYRNQFQGLINFISKFWSILKLRSGDIYSEWARLPTALNDAIKNVNAGKFSYYGFTSREQGLAQLTMFQSLIQNKSADQFRRTLDLYNRAIVEIQNLQKAHGSPEELRTWANAQDVSFLTPADLAEFDKLRRFTG